MSFWLNGQFEEETSAVDIADRGFLLGDGIFETVLLSDATPVFLASHINRMKAGVRTLALGSCPDEQFIAQTISELSERNDLLRGSAVARLTLTRGVGPRGIDTDARNFNETLLLTVSAYLATDAIAPVRLIIASHVRNEKNATSRCKTLNYLDNVLARQEGVAAGADDALMLNTSGNVACATAANLFAIRAGAIMTPAIEQGALPGVARSVLIDSAREHGLTIVEKSLAPDDLRGAMLFMTNSLIGLRPCRMLGSDEYSPADQSVFETLKSCYAAAVDADIEHRRKAG